jgi:hypothetical protein
MNYCVSFDRFAFLDSIKGKGQLFFDNCRKLIALPYETIIESKFVNQKFSWRPYLDPLTEESIQTLSPKIKALNQKIQGLNHAFESASMKSILSSYEVLLTLRCLEYYTNNKNIPQLLNDFVEDLKKENLLLVDLVGENKSFNRKEIKKYIDYFTRLTSKQFRGNFKKEVPNLTVFTGIMQILSPKLVSPHFNRLRPQVSFTKEEWKIFGIMSGNVFNMDKKKWVDFFNKLPIKLANKSFLKKLEVFTQLKGEEIFGVGHELHPCCEFSNKGNQERGIYFDSSSIFWKNLIDHIHDCGGIRNYKPKEINYSQMEIWHNCLEYLNIQGDDFPTMKEADLLGLNNDARTLMLNLHTDERKYWRKFINLVMKFDNLDVLNQLTKKWNELPESILEWNREQIQFVYKVSIQLIHLREENFIDCPFDCLRKLFELKKQIKFHLDHLENVKECLYKNEIPKSLGPFPFNTISKKINYLCQLHRENRLNDATKKDKLTFMEYSWIIDNKAIFQTYFNEHDNQNYADFLDFVQSTPEESSINICFTNNTKISSIEFNKISLSDQTLSMKLKRLIFRICNWIDSNFNKYDHTNFLIAKKNEYTVYGFTGNQREFGLLISGKSNPIIDTFQINFSKLGQHLKVPLERQQEFKHCFENKLLEILKSYENADIYLGSGVKHILKNILSINPFIKPKDFKLYEGKEYFCNEYVLRIFVETACQTLTDLNLPLPQNMKSFGFGYFARKKGITPDHLHRMFMKQGFLTENIQFSNYVHI